MDSRLRPLAACTAATCGSEWGSMELEERAARGWTSSRPGKHPRKQDGLDSGELGWSGTAALVHPQEQGLGPVAEVLGHRPPALRGRRQEAPDPWRWQAGSMHLGVRGWPQGGAEGGSGLPGASSDSKTDRQTDRHLARGSLGGTAASVSADGGRRGPVALGWREPRGDGHTWLKRVRWGPQCPAGKWV